MKFSPGKDVGVGGPGRNLLSKERGQSLLEVALLTPLLLVLLMGSIEFGRYAYLGILVASAARAGAAYGSAGLRQSGDTPGITSAADNDFQSNGQKASTLTITSTLSCGCDNGSGILSYEANTGASCTTVVSTTLDTSCSNGAQGHWVVVVSVTASGTFDPLFGFRGVSKQITVTRTASLRVAND